MTFSRRTFLKTGLSAAALPAGMAAWPVLRAGAQPVPSELVEAAKAEGRVVYYSSTNPALSQRLVDRFNRDYPGISVEIVRLATGPLAKRYAAEIEAGTIVADILQMGDPLILEDGYAKGWFANLADLPAHKAWPQAYRTEYSATVSLFPDTITYNTDKVKGDDVPRQWSDILDPKWRDQILMVDIRNVPQTTAWAAFLQDTYGPDFLPRLRAQNPKFVASTVPGTQMLAAGEAALLIPNLRMVSYSLIEQGAPLDDSTAHPVSGWGSALSITKEAPHPNAARLFTSFILSQPGQEALSKDVAASPLGSLPGALPLAEHFHFADIRATLPRAAELYKLLGLG